jgi:hypothetical protein
LHAQPHSQSEVPLHGGAGDRRGLARRGCRPAAAQQNGLVNVEASRVLNNNQVAVTVPINAAANVCGVSVTALASQVANGPVQCTSRGCQATTVSLPR